VDENTYSRSRQGRSATVTGTRTRGATVTRYTTQVTGMTARIDAGRRAIGRFEATVRRYASMVAETTSAAGWLLLGAGVLGLIAALSWGWTEAWVVATASLTLLLFCFPFLLGHHTYAVTFALDRDRVVAGSEVTATLDVTNRGQRITLPALLDIPMGEGLVEAHIPLLRAGAAHRDTIVISAPKRGVIPVGPMTIGRGDPLGILRREHSWADVQNIYVHPKTAPIPSTSAGLLRDLEGAATKTIVDSDLSFHAIREYLPGDSYRHVHWKSTAKTGTLMVRQYEETRRSRIAVALDLNSAEYASDDEFEMAVSIAASLGQQAVRAGREVIITASAEIEKHERGIVHAIRSLPTLTPIALLDGMAAIDASEDVMPLEQVATMTAQEAPQLSMVFLVTGSLVPVTRLRRAALAFPADVNVIAIRSEPGAEPSLKNAREIRIMTLGMLHDFGHMMLRAAV
jgi:uncharacterized protein (DUF58 family)